MVVWERMEEDVHDFDWDSANAKKCQEHGVSIAEIEALFMNIPLVYPDRKHSSDTEARYSAVKRSAAGRGIFVAFTFRMRNGVRVIRPISARYMHEKEIRYYESL